MQTCSLNKSIFNIFINYYIIILFISDRSLGKCLNDIGILQTRQNTTVQSSNESKSRRRRTAFTSGQLLELEREFQAKKYLSLTERSEIANSLKLSEVQVIIFMRH